jgi:DNA-nicking Smr family endonuclease
VSDDDRELFRRAMRDARPIQKEPRAAHGRLKPKPVARPRRADDQVVLRESPAYDDALVANSSDAVRFQRPSVGNRTMRRLARGNFAVQAEIDLHGMTLAEARPRLEAFLDEAVKSGKRCVRVVHGKGFGSGSRGAVLKPNVDRWLRRWDAVLAFVSSRQADGGTGAVYVLLRAG